MPLCFGIDAERARASPAQSNLQLEVIVNGHPVNWIGSFVLFGDGRIAATAAELIQLGLQVDPKRSALDLINLDDLPTASYKYDERTQQIFITVDNGQRIPRKYELSDRRLETPMQSGTGAVLNYNLRGSFAASDDTRLVQFNGTSLSLDGRAFSRAGTYSQSAYVSSDENWRTQAFRLDSIYRYSDHENLVVYNAGDAITGALAWTRPIRIGGVQMQRSFALRPDLITVPLLGISGDAAVPSTVDLYINEIKAFSQDIGSGPFELANIPVITGAGEARIVVRDAAGHETVTNAPFYSTPYLLAPGLTSFSLEAGFPRLAYGAPDDAYVSSLVGAATLRAGISDWLTLEGHAEGGGGLINAGAGAVVKTGDFGVLSAAIAASALENHNGMQAYLSFETSFLGVSLNVSTLRTFGDYDDLTSATARYQPALADGPQDILGLFSIAPANASGPNAAQFWADARPPKALDRISIGTGAPFDPDASITASFVNRLDAAGGRSQIISASWSRTLPFEASIFATAFMDLGDSKSDGAFIGLSIPLFNDISTSVSAHSNDAGTTVNFDAAKSLGPTTDSYGWRVRDSEGAVPYREASIAYRASFAQMQASAIQSGGGVGGSLEIEGSVAAMGGGVFLSNRIDDAFAVVRVGAPNVPVLYENQQIGVTDADGMILIPTLRSYDKNTITIDPTDLPVDADVATTRSIIAPADRSGVLVDFGVQTGTRSALVIFTRTDGAFVPAGSLGKSDTDEEFIVGYDGWAFLKALSPQNTVVIETPQGPCQAQFSYEPRANEQVTVSPVICRGSGGKDGGLDPSGYF
jgi:outer membrane usher protein